MRTVRLLAVPGSWLVFFGSTVGAISDLGPYRVCCALSAAGSAELFRRGGPDPVPVRTEPAVAGSTTLARARVRAATGLCRGSVGDADRPHRCLHRNGQRPARVQRHAPVRRGVNGGGYGCPSACQGAGASYQRPYGGRQSGIRHDGGAWQYAQLSADRCAGKHGRRACSVSRGSPHFGSNGGFAPVGRDFQHFRHGRRLSDLYTVSQGSTAEHSCLESGTTWTGTTSYRD